MSNQDLTLRALAAHLGTDTRTMRRFLVAKGFLEDHGKGKGKDRWVPTAWTMARFPRVVVKRRKTWLWFAPYFKTCWVNDGRAVSTLTPPPISDAEAALIDSRLRFKSLAFGRKAEGFDADGFTAWAVAKPPEWKKHAVERDTEKLVGLWRSERVAMATA